MRIKIPQIKVALDYKDEFFATLIASRLHCPKSALEKIRLVHRSIDARSKEKAPQFVLALECDIPDRFLNKKNLKLVSIVKSTKKQVIKIRDTANRPRPVVVGAGPGGLMAAYSLAKSGLKPLLIERGSQVEDRTEQVKSFWKDGVLNEESNTLFGEGGAGLFSDGKLTSRSKDRPRLKQLLETLVSSGASDSILIDAEPHLGSDRLSEIVPNLRKKIIKLGGEVRFNHHLDSVKIEDGKLTSVVVNGEQIDTDSCILATGHSARDIYKMLALAEVPQEPKSFAIGVRLELPQNTINVAQWNGWASDTRLGAASFRLTRKEEDGFRNCYTFCMCPGGLSISCASSNGMLTTNGMSLSDRDKKYGNAAFLVPVRPEDIPATEDGEPAVLDGYKFQEGIEKLAFIEGGDDYSLPASRLSDFLDGKVSKNLPERLSNKKAKSADFRKILPSYVCDTLTHAIPKMLSQLQVSSFEDIVIYAAETRSSSPIRITRGKDGHSTGVQGIFPCGEGAGYAGGIVSAGIDGLKMADAVIETYL